MHQCAQSASSSRRQPEFARGPNPPTVWHATQEGRRVARLKLVLYLLQELCRNARLQALLAIHLCQFRPRARYGPAAWCGLHHVRFQEPPLSDGNSLINLGDLSKPATVLIEKVSSAVGLIYEPLHIKRKARAEAEADKIKAVAKIELDELQHRALERFVQQEARKQENIETITAQAASALPPDAKATELDEDWIAHFFKQCDTVSDKEMQSLWARLLSGEATSPGTFSKRTVDFVSSMDKKDAALFTNFCQFVWFIGEPQPLIYQVEDELLQEHGINFSTLKHLDAIGLISLESLSGYLKKGFKKYARCFYHGRPTVIEFPADENNQLSTGHVLLTAIGKELAPICGSERNEKFYESVIKKWFDEGLVLSSMQLHSH